MRDPEITAPEVLSGLDALMEGRTNAPEARRLFMTDKAKARVIDFDAWRAERLTREGALEPEPVYFRIGGKDYTMPHEPPATIVLDIVRLKESLGSDAEVSVEALMGIGTGIFGRDAWDEILRENRLGATELGDVIIQAFNAWPDQLVSQEDAVPNRKTRRGRSTSD